MSVKHTSYRLPDDAKHKLKELAELDSINSTEVLNNLIQAEHRYRRADIDKMRASRPKQAEQLTDK